MSQMEVAASEPEGTQLPPSSSSTTPATSLAESTAMSRKKQKKALKVTQKIKFVEGSVDVRVQHTNDDSVVSKRSTVAHGYIRDRFLRHFVAKPSRRSPLINRGYYLRMAVMTDLVVRFIRAFLHAPERATESAAAPPPPVQVLSLGAGYDTLAFRLLLDSVDVLNATKKPAKTEAGTSPLPSTPASFPGGDVLFVDVDFPAVLQSKAALMAAAPPGSFPVEWRLAPKSADQPVVSPFYSAVGVDLRAASAELLPRLRHYAPAGFDPAHPTIIYAECVMQYMPHEDATRLVALLAESFPNAVFMAYDQVGPLDSFGRVMQTSLRQKNSPLLGIQACPGGAAMTQRAYAAGMRRAWWGDFYRISSFCIAGAERARVEGLEDFDELEEWAEMCEHYGITMAATPGAWDSVVARGCAGHPAFVAYESDGTTTAAEPIDVAAERSDCAAAATRSVVSASLRAWPSARFGFEGWGNGGVAVEPLANGDRLLFSFGGFAVGKQHQRVNTVYAHSLQEGELRVVVAGGGGGVPAGAATTATPAPLVFHSFTRVAAGQFLVWGGRTSPSAPTNDAVLLTVDVPRTVSLGSTVTARWRPLRVVGCGGAEEVADEPLPRPSPRFRHCMVALSTSDDAAEATLILLGGKTAVPGRTVDCFRVRVHLAEGTISYESLNCLGATPDAEEVPPPVHSAAAVALSSDVVLLSGGLQAGCDVCSPHLWRLQVSTRTWTRLPISLGPGRFGHSLTRVVVGRAECLLVLGGNGWTEKSSLPAAVLLRCTALDAAAAAASPNAPATSPTVAVSLPADAPWWSRHSCVAISDGVVGVLGGGYTCFSFGTFAAKPQLLHLGDAVGEGSWQTGTATPAKASTTVAAGAPAPVYSYDRLLSKPWPAVREVALYNAETFLAVASAATEPVVFRSVPLGDCVARWGSPAYLQEVEGGATVSVHVAERSQLLDFVRKNFAFRHVSLAEVVQHVTDATTLFRETQQTPAETWYYRSVAAHMKSERSNIWTDFPALGRDFVLPPGAREFIEPRLHQSCLRMNAPPLQLWTHYDTLDNVLCQVVGTKRVVLFPPSAYNDLYMTGSSSAVINLDAPDLVRYPRFIEACKSAQEVMLRPGDMLFFPAMWFHHITTLSPKRTDAVEAQQDAAAAADAPYNISVNVFFRHFSDATVYDAKDLYGNKDALAVTRIRDNLQSAVRDVLASAHLTGAAEPQPVPSVYAEFAVRQFLQDLDGTAGAMADARRAGSDAH